MTSDLPQVRLLWIAPKFPLGNPDGARHATSVLLRHLTQLGTRVDLVCLVPAGEKADAALAQEQLGVETCTLIRRSGSHFWPLPSLKTPFTFRTFAGRAVRRQLHKAVARFQTTITRRDFGGVVFDGLHTVAALPENLKTLAGACGRIIYRAHNVETVLWEQCLQKARGPASRGFFRHQAALVRRFEERVAKTVDVIAPVSDEDAERFKSMAPSTALCVTRIGMDFPDPASIPPVWEAPTFDLLFLGRLDWLPNRSGLRWFLESVWPALVDRRPKATLTIAGTGNADWLARYKSHPGIKVLGRVDRVEPLYQSCALSIAPLFQGSGTRVKLIESARFKRGAISTALGAEGSGLVPGTSYCHAETREEWLERLNRLTLQECRAMGIAAFRGARERFDARAAAVHLLTTLAPAGVCA